MDTFFENIVGEPIRVDCLADVFQVALSNLSLSLFLVPGRKMDDSPPRTTRPTFAWLVGASQVVGLLTVVLTGVWMGHYRGGFAWDGSAQEFNLHPLCMVLGMVFLQGDGESAQFGFSVLRFIFRIFLMFRAGSD